MTLSIGLNAKIYHLLHCLWYWFILDSMLRWNYKQKYKIYNNLALIHLIDNMRYSIHKIRYRMNFKCSQTHIIFKKFQSDAKINGKRYMKQMILCNSICAWRNDRYCLSSKYSLWIDVSYHYVGKTKLQCDAKHVCLQQ